MAIRKKTAIDAADELGVSPEELNETSPFDEEAYGAPIELDVDFEAGGVQEYTDGTYHARLEAVERKVAQTGNPMLVWRFRTLQDKRAWWLNTVLTRDAQWKVTETVVGLGVTGEGSTRINVSKLVGNCCRLVIKNEVYEGAKRPGVKKVLPATQETRDLNDLG